MIVDLFIYLIIYICISQSDFISSCLGLSLWTRWTPFSRKNCIPAIRSREGISVGSRIKCFGPWKFFTKKMTTIGNKNNLYRMLFKELFRVHFWRNLLPHILWHRNVQIWAFNIFLNATFEHPESDFRDSYNKPFNLNVTPKNKKKEQKTLFWSRITDSINYLQMSVSRL